MLSDQMRELQAHSRDGKEAHPRRAQMTMAAQPRAEEDRVSPLHPVSYNVPEVRGDLWGTAIQRRMLTLSSLSITKALIVCLS